MTPERLPQHASIPLLMGNAATEATFYFGTDKRHLGLTARQVRQRLQAQFRVDEAQAQALMQDFRRDDPDRTPSQVLVTLISDMMFRIPMMAAAEAKSRAHAPQAPVYLYNFAWRSPADGGIWGSPHAIDIPFAFGNTDKATELTGTGPEAAQVSRALMSAFVAFARSGNPSNPRMPRWTPFDAQSRATMLIDNTCRLVNNYRAADRAAGTALKLDPYDRAALFTYAD